MALNRKMSGYDEDLDERRKEKAEAPAVLPKSILMGKSAEVGDTLTLKIDRITEDGLVVSYSKAEPDQEEEVRETPPPETPETPDEEMLPTGMSGYD